MEQEFISWLASENGMAVHASVFTLLMLGSIGFPIPEDIPILLAGVAASKGIVSVPSIFLTSYIGVVLADQFIYFLGYYFGQRMLKIVTESPLFPSATEEKIEEVREGLRKRRLFYIFLGRHLFPVRSVTFITAGAVRIPYIEFLLTDAFAALISVALIGSLGYYLGDFLTPEFVQHLVHKAHVYVLAFVVVFLLAFYLRRYIKQRKKNVQVS